MSEREPDFEFDFFEEPETREAQGAERSFRRPTDGPKGPRRPGRPPLRPSAGFAPLLRLVGLVAVGILIVALLVLWAQSCQEEQRGETYRDYVSDVSAIARESEQVGRRLNEVLTTQAIQPADLDRRLVGLTQQQTIGVGNARSLDPPGPLRAAHASLVQALEFRASGLDGLGAAFRRTRGSDDAPAAGALLSSQAQRLAASDVIWDDLFVEAARAELREQDVSGVEVPDSNFVQTADLASTRTMVQVWQRINGAPAAGGGGGGAGLHGSGLGPVTVLPAGTQLSSSAETKIVASTDLAFRVAVENTGDNQEVDIEVTLTIEQSPTPVTRTRTIDLINPGETKNVVFRDFSTVDLAEPRTLRVDVEPVTGEARLDNNSAEYVIILSFE